MRDCFYQFLRSDTVLDSFAKVKSKLVGTIQRNKCGYRDQTSVALGQFFAFPDISEKDIFGQLGKLGREVADQCRDACGWFILSFSLGSDLSFSLLGDLSFSLLGDRRYGRTNPSVTLVVDDPAVFQLCSRNGVPGNEKRNNTVPDRIRSYNLRTLK